MAALSEETIKARIKVLELCAGWIEGQTGLESTDLLIDESGEYDEHLVREAESLSKKLYAQASKLKEKLIEK